MMWTGWLAGWLLFLFCFFFPLLSDLCMYKFSLLPRLGLTCWVGWRCVLGFALSCESVMRVFFFFYPSAHRRRCGWRENPPPVSASDARRAHVHHLVQSNPRGSIYFAAAGSYEE